MRAGATRRVVGHAAVAWLATWTLPALAQADWSLQRIEAPRLGPAKTSLAAEPWLPHDRVRGSQDYTALWGTGLTGYRLSEKWWAGLEAGRRWTADGAAQSDLGRVSVSGQYGFDEMLPGMRPYVAAGASFDDARLWRSIDEKDGVRPMFRLGMDYELDRRVSSYAEMRGDFSGDWSTWSDGWWRGQSNLNTLTFQAGLRFRF